MIHEFAHVLDMRDGVADGVPPLPVAERERWIGVIDAEWEKFCARVDAGEQTLIDPYGGQRDLAAKVLRHVSPAFAEDPVRILRLARFAARFADFSVAPETVALMRDMVAAGEVDALVAERVWQELSRGLMERRPSRMIEVLREAGAPLAEANAKDIAAAEAAGLAAPMVDRLRLTPKVLETVAEGCEQLAAMPDPIGEITGVKRRPTGISVGQMRVPLGVFGMIYESRPNVTIEAASLAIKSGNACILRGGSEALHSNRALIALVQDCLAEAGLPREAAAWANTSSAEATIGPIWL